MTKLPLTYNEAVEAFCWTFEDSREVASNRTASFLGCVGLRGFCGTSLARWRELTAKGKCEEGWSRNDGVL